MTSVSLNFRESPFSATPNPLRFCAVGSSEEARLRLVQAIDRAEGPALLIGPSGTGKSLLCQILADFYRGSYSVVCLAESRLCTRRALLQHILFHLDLPFKGLSEGELRLSLLDRLRPEPSKDPGLLLILDEAHTLPRRLLEELRMISGVVRNGKPRVRLVLAGGMKLEDTMADPRMEAFEQRIAVRCYLHPFGLEETTEYVRRRFSFSGVRAETIIDQAAVSAAHHAADGIPRLLNRVLDRAIALGAAAGAPRISRELIEAAWSDLQQLPAPYTDDAPASFSRSGSTAAPASSAIEFGPLDEFGDEDGADEFRRDMAPGLPDAPALERVPPVEAAHLVYCTDLPTGKASEKTQAEPQLAGCFWDDTAWHSESSEAASSCPRQCGESDCCCTTVTPEPCSSQSLSESAYSFSVLGPTAESAASDQEAPVEPNPAPIAATKPAWPNKPASTKPSPTVVNPFVDQFDGVFDLAAQTRIVLTDDKVPAKAPSNEAVCDTTTSSAELRFQDVARIAKHTPGEMIPTAEFEAEELLHREIISLSEAANPHQKRSPAGPRSDNADNDTDDRDLLVIEDCVEAVRPSGPKAATRSSSTDYRSLFSRLRNG